MQILLLRAGPDNAWQPLGHLADALARRAATAVGIVVDSPSAELPRGTLALPAPARAAHPALAAPAVQAALAQAAADGHTRWVEADAGALQLFVLPLSLPPRVLLLGAGPDAAPVADFAARLHWKVTLADHRAAYAVGAHFPTAERVVHATPQQLPQALDLAQFSAAVIMSHHLVSDLAYLRVLARTPVRYIGLLGPVARRDRLLAQLTEEERGALRPRLRAPVGLPLGGRAPESVALAIVAQILAFLHERGKDSYSS